MKKIPLGPAELAVLREKAEELRDGSFKTRGDALLPLTLATFIFDSLCLPGDYMPFSLYNIHRDYKYLLSPSVLSIEFHHYFCNFFYQAA